MYHCHVDSQKYIEWYAYVFLLHRLLLSASRVARGGGKGAEFPLESKKIAKKREKVVKKEGGNGGKKREKMGKGEKMEKKGKYREEKAKNREEKAKNREGSFTLPLLTERAGYATVIS